MFSLLGWWSTINVPVVDHGEEDATEYLLSSPRNAEKLLRSIAMLNADDLFERELPKRASTI